jgi:predicted MFS family arabinose efflux permease
VDRPDAREQPSFSPPAIGRDGALVSLSVPAFAWLWLCGLLWNLTRWSSLFLAAWLINELTDSPFLVQLSGAIFFAPMLFGGMLAGAISDRLDRRLTLLVTLAALVAASALMATVALAGATKAWMVYPFVLAIGTGAVVEMTARRALAYDLVGDARLTNALALESLSSAFGNMVGAAIAGAVISLLGVGSAFVAIAACYVAALLALWRVAPPARQSAVARPSLRRDLAEGLRYVLADRRQVSVLGVTVMMNLFMFSFIPLVPVIAEDFDASAFLAGVLASGTGIGSVAGSIVLAARTDMHRGRLYAGGALLAMAGLFLFALAPWYAAALGALVLAGLGLAAFVTTQSILPMVIAGMEMRGRAMGVMSMAIGALPLGMVALGALAQGVGPAVAVALSVAAGIVAMAAWLSLRPEVLRTR